MQTLLMTLLAFSMPLMGSWRLTLEQDPSQAFHLVGDPDKGLFLYDDEWYPITIRSFSVEGDRFHLETDISSGVHQTYTFEGAIKEDTRLQGKSTVHILQHILPGTFSGLKIDEKPLLSPIEAVAHYRKEGVIDLVSLLRDKAPGESFSDFMTFWEEEIEPYFYVFLNKKMYGYHNSSSARKEFIQRIFEKLPNYADSDVEAARTAAEARQAASTQIMQGILLLPDVIQSEMEVVPVTSKVNEDYCCDQPLYWKEHFLFYPVPAEE